jgi:protein TonB
MISKPVLLSVILLGLAPSLALAQTVTPPAMETPPQSPRADLYPERAQRMAVEGDASVRCMVTTEGLLTLCVIVSERPIGFGFGEATLRAARNLRMKPAMRDGVPVEGVVTIPMGWRLGHGKPPAAPPASQR